MFNFKQTTKLFFVMLFTLTLQAIGYITTVVGGVVLAATLAGFLYVLGASAVAHLWLLWAVPYGLPAVTMWPIAAAAALIAIFRILFVPGDMQPQPAGNTLRKLGFRTLAICAAWLFGVALYCTKGWLI